MQTLYRKYRPQDFDNFYGNNNSIQTIKNSLINSKLSHAYLFSGPRGTGKTSLARLISKSLNCSNLKNGYNPCSECSSCLSISKGTFPDMIEIDAASNRGIDEIREIKDRVQYKPLIGKFKVYIIDEVHMLTKEAFNAILKTLEEPPKHAIFILATTEPSRIPDTVHSRCQRYSLHLLDKESILDRLKYISKKENRDIDEELLSLVYRESGASMRDALSLLEKILISFPEGTLSIKQGEDALGVVPKEVLTNLFNAYKEKDSNKILDIIDDSWMKGYKIESLMKDLAFTIREKIGGRGIGDIEKIFTCLNEFKWEDNKRAVGYVLANRLIENNSEVAKVHKAVISEEKTEKIQEKREVKAIPMAKESIVLPINTKKIKKDIVFEKKNDKPKKVDSSNIVEQKEEVKVSKVEKKISVIAKTADIIIGDINISEIWSDILSEAKDVKLSLMIFLTSAKIGSFNSGTLELIYDKEHAFHKESLSKIDNRLLLEDLLTKKLKRDIKIKVVGEDSKKESSSFNSTLEDLLREEGMINE